MVAEQAMCGCTKDCWQCRTKYPKHMEECKDQGNCIGCITQNKPKAEDKDG